jgi:hydrogenase-4 component F
MQIIFIVALPLILAVMTLPVKRIRALVYLTSFGYLLGLILSLRLVFTYLADGKPITFANIIYADSLSVFFILAISIVSFAASLYSQGFIAQDLSRRLISKRKSKLYYLLFNCFIFTMYMVVTVNNLGLMWVAIELTTLTSTFLVGFYNTKNSVEAAWKYIIICSVGIILALLGTILFSYALLFASGLKSLNWTDFMASAGHLDPKMVKIAFIFIMIGYGTKAGLAPMHTWLPDAHSQAVSPISALLSGLLLKTAIFAILRFAMITLASTGYPFIGHIFITFGLLSLAVSAGLILVQRDIKRLLAYSSIEHIGIIFVGLGLGGIGIFAALFHILNHAVTKSLMFFGAGNIVSAYNKHKISQIRGVIQSMPFTGTVFLLGTFAIAGFPPFSIFRSEFLILMAAFGNGSYITASLTLLFLAVVFAALIYHFGDMLFGKKPENMPKVTEQVSIELALVFLFAIILILGLYIPGPLNELLTKATALIGGTSNV